MSASILIQAPTTVEGDDDVASAACILTEGLDVAVDLRSTEVLTAEGCRALVRLQGVADETGRKLTLFGPQRLVREVMVLSGVLDVIEVRDRQSSWFAGVRSR